MFPQKRRSEYRKQYKKFVISCEGSVTEREYFDRLRNICWNGVALSNPKFELWLLVHFMDLPQICGPSECDRFLRSHMSVDGKHIIPSAYTLTSIESAVARSAVACPGGLCPRTITGTTVGVLVNHIVSSAIL